MSAAAKRLTEMERILRLPERDVLDCERDELRRWAPEAQALVEHVTALYALPARRTCGCRSRTVQGLGGGRVLVLGHPAMGDPPPPPEEMAADEFRAESPFDVALARRVAELRRGQVMELEGLGRSPCITSLNAFQAWSLWELPRAGGLFGMGSVGTGKTIFFLLAPLTMPHLKKWVLLAKPDQRLHYQRHYLRLREHFRVPSMVFDKGGAAGSYIVRGAPVLDFVPYSVLSNKKSTTLFEQADPEAILADEVHCIANSQSSRGGRFVRHMVKRNGRVFAGATGTPIDKSIRNFANLLTHALGVGSPLPVRQDEIHAWSQVFDPVQIPDTESATAKAIFREFGDGEVDPELAEIGMVDVSQIRKGLRDRIIRTPGITSTRSSSVEVDLVFRERKIKMPESLSEPLQRARMGMRPDGEELAEQSEIAVCSRAVSAGYYYYWAYPKATAEERQRGGLIDQWFAARKAFNKELRGKLLMNEPHLDSRKLCENAAERAWREPRYDGDLPVWQALTWPEWVEIRDRVQPEPRVKWLNDYLARDAAEWAREHVGIVWSRSRAFGKRVAELAGIDYCGGGDNAEAYILSHDGSKSIVASIRSHYEGRDGLQERFSKQLWAENLPSGKGVQQLLGRLARPGQTAEEVETWVYRHTLEYRHDLDRAIELAEFLRDQTRDKQLILSASMEF